jgi:stalled ribosome rescue protein Dom34
VCALLSHVVQEGLAHLCLVGSSTTLVRAKIEANLPRKRGPAIAGYDKAFDKFMDQVGHCCDAGLLVDFVHFCVSNCSV